MGDDTNDFIKWKDTKTATGFKREMDNVTKYINQDGRIEYTDGEYYFPDYPVTDFEADEKLGAIDFETFGEKGSASHPKCLCRWLVYKAF